jgi:GNAT superfamily N-acetyltransferase
LNHPVRQIDYAKDWSDLSAFLVEKDVSRLQLCCAAADDNDAYILVAERNERAIGVAVVHIAARDDMGWDYDKETPSFLVGTNAYLENIEVSKRMRRKGVGTLLLREVENEARRRGKERLWLHTDEVNVGAHRFYERNGWTHHDAVEPAWKQGRATRIYVKEL